MSTVDLCGPIARIDKWKFRKGFSQGWRVAVSRLHWLGALLVLALLGVPALWLEQDPLDRATTLEALLVHPPERVTMPLDINPRVERWLDAFQTTRRAEFEIILDRRGLYADMIRGKLRARGMPEELLSIPMIESGLFPNAVSRVSAVGLWQFMSPTASQYGLRLDTYVDERRDPIRATDAALDYLAVLHERFGGSWYLAAAAFNAGPGRLQRILNLHAGGRIGDEALYWEIIDYLPRETREYVPKMIAVTRLANDADAWGFDTSRMARKLFENVFVPGGTSLRSVALALDLDANGLRDLNPHLIRGVTPPGEIYGIRIPVGGAATVVNAMAGRPPTRKADD
jgi:membrane-bound lytic murein transglycosylase D